MAPIGVASTLLRGGGFSVFCAAGGGSVGSTTAMAGLLNLSRSGALGISRTFSAGFTCRLLPCVAIVGAVVLGSILSIPFGKRTCTSLLELRCSFSQRRRGHGELDDVDSDGRRAIMYRSRWLQIP
jgi:hypothetical protein